MTRSRGPTLPVTLILTLTLRCRLAGGLGAVAVQRGAEADNAHRLLEVQRPRDDLRHGQVGV